MIAPLRELLERPVDARPGLAFLAAAGVVLLIAAGLALTADSHTHQATADRDHVQVPALPGSPASPATVAAPVPGDEPVTTAGLATPGSDRNAVAHAARRFLAGYLPYLYGRGPASRIGQATAVLRRRLAAARLRASPAAGRRRPTVVDLRPRRLRGGRWLVVASIADGGVSRYPIELLLEHVAQHPVVTAVVGE